MTKARSLKGPEESKSPVLKDKQRIQTAEGWKRGMLKKKRGSKS